MKPFFCLIMLAGILSGIACNKFGMTLTPLASINVVNATVNLNSALVKFNPSPGSKTPGTSYNDIPISVGFGTNYVYGVLAGKSVGMVVVSADDTTNIIYNATLKLANGALYSLYLAGQIGSVDTVMMQDNIPYYTGDSLTGVRFINLSQGSTPVNVTLDVTQSAFEFSNISYKQITPFKTYSAGAINASYTFDVFQASNDSLLAQYTLATPIFKNVTLALTGIVSSGLSIIQINNY